MRIAGEFARGDSRGASAFALCDQAIILVEHRSAPRLLGGVGLLSRRGFEQCAENLPRGLYRLAFVLDGSRKNAADKEFKVSRRKIAGHG